VSFGKSRENSSHIATNTFAKAMSNIQKVKYVQPNINEITTKVSPAGSRGYNTGSIDSKGGTII